MDSLRAGLETTGKSAAALCVCVALSPFGSAAEAAPRADAYPPAVATAAPPASPARSGLTYTELRGVREGAVVFGCEGDCAAPDVSALACEASAPLLCIRDVAAPGPVGMASDVWSAGLLARTPPLKGTSMTSRREADRACRVAFGTDWRMASVEDGNRGRIGGYALDGSASEDGPVWIASRTRPEATCW